MENEEWKSAAPFATRRGFLKATGVAAALPALASLAACAPRTLADTQGEDAGGTADEYEGEWLPCRCSRLYCSASCINYALVKDGQVLRVKTDDRFEDSDDMPQQRGCVRGRMKRTVLYAPDRLKYPMKRKNWEPGGGRKDLRGKDEWVRITWDEALDIIASELRRIIDAYGNEAICRSGTYNNGLLSTLGGSWASIGGDSLGGWIYPTRYMVGLGNLDGYYGEYLYNDRFDLMNSKLIVFFGNNPSWSAPGWPNKILMDAKRAGAKIIGVNPYFNHTLSSIADEWVPVRPATDAALLLGCAHYMIENDLQDQEFLDRCTIGFDDAHMPEGADARDNFKDYVLGTYDGVPKTPEWASAICGATPEAIRSLAHDMATIKPAAIFACSAITRGFRGEQAAQAFFTVGWMTGNVGKPGAMVSDMSGTLYANGGKPLVEPGAPGRPQLPDPLANVVPFSNGVEYTDGLVGIMRQEQWNAILTGEFSNGKWGTKKCNIQFIWDIGKGNKLNQCPATLKAIEAYRKVEFVVSAENFFTPTAQYADVVLPSIMQWEFAANFSTTSNRETLTYTAQVSPPRFEARSDYEVCRGLAERLGIDPDAIDISEEQIFFNQVVGAHVMKEDGSDYEPLFTLTQEDIDEFGFGGEPQQGRIDFQQFKKDGIYQVKRSPGDNFGFIALKDFAEDPEGNPLATESGKLEIYCRKLSEAIDWFDSYHIAPIAKYEPPQEGYETTFADFGTRKPGPWPLQLVTPHTIAGMNSKYDNNLWRKEIFPLPLYINPLDAEARGIKSEDAVKVSNGRGAIVRHAKLTERVMPGVVMVAQGGWTDYDEDLQVDFGGNANVLTSDDRCGADIQPWNTVNVQVEKWGDEVAYDYEKPLKIADLGE